MSELDVLRGEIDALDMEILTLLNRRMQTSVNIGRAKQSLGGAVLDRDREYAVFEKLLNYAANMVMPQSAVLDIYSAIIKASRALQSDSKPAAIPRLYAVLGHPVGHSLSPAMHNRAFGFVNYSGLFFAVDTTNVGQTVKALKTLDFGGAAVTMPHKESIMEYLDETEASAQAIGAVNTVVNCNGRLLGYNTDSEGAISALKAKTELKDKRVLLLGAGGAARALAFGLKAEKARLVISNRDEQKGGKLAENVNATFISPAAVLTMEYDIVINATAAGMYPNVNVMPVPNAIFKQNMVVMDIVYNPMQTMFLKLAAAKGCLTINGLDMFVHQGGRQFELWTGGAAPLPIMRQTALSLLNQR